MRRTSRLARTLGALSVVALIAAACGGDDEETGGATGTGETGGETTATAGGEGEQAAGGSYSVYICEPQHLIPTNTNETCGSEVLHALYSPLVTYDDESNPQWGDEAPNAMAQEITSEDNQTWTITIKDGWTFHNGEPVTAQSFVDAWNFGAYGPNAQGNSYFFGNVEGYDDLQPAEEGGEPAAETLAGLTAVDDTTIEVTLTEPFTQFPVTLGYTAFYPAPPQLQEDSDAFNEAPIGNGPYMMDGMWQHDQAINTVKFEDFGGGEPGNADAIEFRIYADPNTAYNDLRGGALDVMDQVPSEQMGTAPDEFGDRFDTSPSSGYWYIGMPHYNEFFANDQVAQALSMAMDREAIIEAVFAGTRSPAGSVVSPVVQGGGSDACGEMCDYDPEQAKQLWDEVSDGFQPPMRFWFNSDGGHEEWIQAVTSQWSQNLGIPQDQIQFESLQFADYLTSLENQEIDGPYRLGWIMDYPSPQNYLEPMHSTEGSSNYDDYSNEEVDQLIAQGNQAPTIEEAIEFYQQAEELVVADFHHIPLWFGDNQFAWSENITGVEMDAFDHLNTAEIQVTSE